MTTYVAMLRGVNVGGNTLKMEWLREACADLGLRDVRTYVQSGNIVFGSSLGAAKLVQTLKETIDAQTRLPATVVVRTAAEIARIVAGNPFLKQKGVDSTKLHVTFLAKAPANPARDKLDALAGARDAYRLAGSEIYLHCPINYGETKLSNAALEKALASARPRATGRPWRRCTRWRRSRDGAGCALPLCVSLQLASASSDNWRGAGSVWLRSVSGVG